MSRLPLLLAFALAGCVTAGKRGNEAAMAVYDLGPAAATAAVGAPPVALEVRAPAWLDSPGMLYRLAYADPARLRDYTRARWAGPPAQLMQQRLLRQLGLVPHGQGGAKCLWRIEVDEFSQVFTAEAQSHGLLEARLYLLDSGRRILAERPARFEVPAASQDSRGGAAALAGAVERLAKDMAAWRAELSAAGKLKAC